MRGNRPIQQRNRVDNLHIQAGPPHTDVQLHLAGGTAGGHVPGPGGSQIVGFTFQYLERSLRNV